MSRAALTISPLLEPQTLAQLQGLELRARKIVEGYVAGLHRSPYRGFSNEFAEHREYAPGDDLRYVDWKVFGKSDRFYLKQFEEETNLLCYLLLDTSESMQYQGPHAPLSKFAYAQCAAVALAYLVLHQRDAVGLVTFDQEIRQVIRPSSNPTQLKQVLHVMEEATATRKTRTGPIFHDLAERLGRRGIVVIISDLFDDVESMLAGLKHRPPTGTRSRGTGFSVSTSDHVQGTRGAGRRNRRTAGSAGRLSARDSSVCEVHSGRVPRAADRLCHHSHRSAARCGAEDVSVGAQEASQMISDFGFRFAD